MAEQQGTQIVKSASTQIEAWMNDGKMMDRIGAALSGYLDAKTFAAQCVLAAKDKNLADCTPVSLFEAFLVCAQMGLLPGKHHAHVALIPRNDRDTGRKLVDVMPQWQGFKFLMERQPGIKRVTPVLVHTTDDFEWNNATGELTHTFDPFSEDRLFVHPADAGECGTGLRGGYLKIEHEDGEVRYHFVSAAKIEAARKCSQTPDLDKWGKPGVWRKWFPEQCVKTVLRDAWARRAVNIDPTLESRFSETAQADDKLLGNDPSRGGYVDVQVEVSEPAKSGMGKLKDKLMPKAAPETARQGTEAPQTVGKASEDKSGRPAASQGPCCPSCKSYIGDMPVELQEEIGRTGLCPECPKPEQKPEQGGFFDDSND